MAAARLGARVAQIERERTGGDCLWTGCGPSKALLAAASRAAEARHAAALGVSAPAVDVDFAAVMRHVRATIAAIEPQDSPTALREAGVRVIAGDATFTGPNAVEVGGERVAFHHALITTGGSPAVPPVPRPRGGRPVDERYGVGARITARHAGRHARGSIRVAARGPRRRRPGVYRSGA